MINIRAGTESDVTRVNDYYETHRRSRGANAGDFILLAEDDGRLIGVVRLCREQGHLVLRGMSIQRDYRRQGLGTRMLRQLVEHIGDRDCFSLPWAHLEGFYGVIGFERVADEHLPAFLRERLRNNREQMEDSRIQQLMQDDLGVYPADGLEFIGMKRLRTRHLLAQ